MVSPQSRETFVGGELEGDRRALAFFVTTNQTGEWQAQQHVAMPLVHGSLSFRALCEAGLYGPDVFQSHGDEGSCDLHEASEPTAMETVVRSIVQCQVGPVDGDEVVGHAVTGGPRAAAGVTAATKKGTL